MSHFWHPALKYGYPKKKAEKLLERKRKCLAALKILKPNHEYNMFSKEASINAQNPPNLGNFNPNIPAFSSSLKVSSSPEQRRHVIAARDIEPGEVLAVEESYCSFLTFNERLIGSCSVCFMRCPDIIFPCPDCCTCFCSEKCRSLGLTGPHKKECEIIHYLLDLSLANSEITNAVRILVRTTFTELKEKLPLLEKESKEWSSEKLGFDEGGVFRSSDYRSVYHTTACNSRKPNSKIYSMAIYAFVITKVLQKCKKFFVDRSGNELTPSDEDLILTGTALLYHCAYDDFFLDIADMKVSRTINLQSQIIGAGLFPSVWLLRDSCDANTFHHNVGSKMVVRSLVSIPAGSEVTRLCPGSVLQIPKEPSKLKLKVLGIDWSCETCVSKWRPGAISFDHLVFKCVKCSAPVKDTRKDSVLKCTGCNLEYPLGKSVKHEHSEYKLQFLTIFTKTMEAFKRYQSILTRMVEGRVTDGDFKDICTYIKALQKHAAMPCKALCNSRQVMIKYFYSQYIP